MSPYSHQLENLFRLKYFSIGKTQTGVSSITLNIHIMGVIIHPHEFELPHSNFFKKNKCINFSEQLADLILQTSWQLVNAGMDFQKAWTLCYHLGIVQIFQPSHSALGMVEMVNSLLTGYCTSFLSIVFAHIIVYINMSVAASWLFCCF